MENLDPQTLARLTLPLVIAVLSFFMLGNLTTTPEFHEDSILSF